VPFATEGDLMISQSVYFSYDFLDLANAAGQPTRPPTASITSPKPGSAFKLGQNVKTGFSCAEGNAGPGLASCTDSHGASAPTGRLDTSRPGRHTYTVTAVSKDGRRGSTSIRYLVRPPVPVLTGLHLSRHRFRAMDRGGPVVRRGGIEIMYRDTLGGVTTFTVWRRQRGHSLVRVGSFKHRDRAGRIRIHFSGRLHGRALRSGAYVVKVRTVAHGQKSKTLGAAFWIVGRRR
jgi:hypothetical protein